MVFSKQSTLELLMASDKKTNYYFQPEEICEHVQDRSHEIFRPYEAEERTKTDLKTILSPPANRIRDHDLLIDGYMDMAKNNHGLRGEIMRTKYNSFQSYDTVGQSVTSTILRGTVLCPLHLENRINVLSHRFKEYDAFANLSFDPYSVINIGTQSITVNAPHYKGLLFCNTAEPEFEHVVMSKIGYSFQINKIYWTKNL